METIYSLLLKASSDNARPCLLDTTGRTISYDGLFNQMSVICRQLTEAGLKRDNVIVVAMPNGPELAAAMLSTACCAICAPLSHDDPDAEIERSILAITPDAMLVSSGTSIPTIQIAERLGVPVISLEEMQKDSLVEDKASISSHKENAIDPPSPDDTAMIFSTSGSSSLPKLVPLSHANVAHAISGTRDSLELTSNDRSLNVLSIIHIHGFVGGLLACLSAGGSVICAPKFVGAHFFAWIADLNPTFLTAVPPIYKEIAALASDHPERVQSHSLRLVRTASAPMPLELADRVEQLLGVPMVVSYGMTEASPLIASGSPTPGTGKRGSVGKPFGTEVRIVKEHATACDPFEEGEIEIRGYGVFSNYLNSADRKGAWTDDGWFRTKDLGYMDSEGHLFVSGRLTEIINRGGSKVSPARIDELVRTHPEVVDAATFPVDHPTLGQDVNCAVVRKSSELSTQTLLDFLGEQLPTSHRPSKILFVEEIPVTPNGKLSRRSLSNELAEQLIAPESETASTDQSVPGTMFDTVARIWEELLEQPVLDSTDFFAAGGDSLTMIRCLAELNELYDTLFPIDTFLNNPVLGEFVSGLEQELEELA